MGAEITMTCFLYFMLNANFHLFMLGTYVLFYCLFKVKEYEYTVFMYDLQSLAQSADVKKVWVSYHCNYAIFRAIPTVLSVFVNHIAPIEGFLHPAIKTVKCPPLGHILLQGVRNND